MWMERLSLAARGQKSPTILPTPPEGGSPTPPWTRQDFWCQGTVRVQHVLPGSLSPSTCPACLLRHSVGCPRLGVENRCSTQGYVCCQQCDQSVSPTMLSHDIYRGHDRDYGIVGNLLLGFLKETIAALWVLPETPRRLEASSFVLRLGAVLRSSLTDMVAGTTWGTKNGLSSAGPTTGRPMLRDLRFLPGTQPTV